MAKIDDNISLPIIGSTEFIEVAGIKDVPAKIDTGADISAIWASNISMEEDGTLSFSLFGPNSPLYNGERLQTKKYRVTQVRSSHGDKQIRYLVKLPFTFDDDTKEATFTLANRSRNTFPVLIGRRAIEGRFLVDVAKSSVARQKPTNSPRLNQELQNNPYNFHQKYFNKKEGK